MVEAFSQNKICGNPALKYNYGPFRVVKIFMRP